MFMLFYVLTIVALLIMTFALGAAATSVDADAGLGIGGTVGMSLLIVFILGSFIPQLAVQVRRFHDQDKSGWFVLFNFVPYIGGIIVFVFMCIEGTQGDNQYGADPKQLENVADVFA